MKGSEEITMKYAVELKRKNASNDSGWDGGDCIEININGGKNNNGLTLIMTVPYGHSADDVFISYEDKKASVLLHEDPSKCQTAYRQQLDLSKKTP